MTRLILTGCLALAACATGAEPGAPNSGSVSIGPAVAPAPIVTGEVAAATMAVYFTISNGRDEPDSIVSITTPLAQQATLHDQMDHGGSAMMMPASGRLSAGGALALSPGATHLMLEGLSHVPEVGETFPLTIVLAHGGTATLRVRTVSYADLEAALDAARVSRDRTDFQPIADPQ